MDSRNLTITRTEADLALDDEDIDPQLEVWLQIMGIPKGAHVFNPSTDILTWADEPNEHLDMFIESTLHPEPAELRQPELPLKEAEATQAEVVLHTSTTAHKDTPDTLTLVTVQDLRSALDRNARQRVRRIRADRADRAAQQREATRRRNAAIRKKGEHGND